MSLQCKYCSKPFKQQRYLMSHYQQNRACNAKWQEDHGVTGAFNPIGQRETRSRARAAAEGLGETDTGRPAKAPNVGSTPPRLTRNGQAIPHGLLDEDAGGWEPVQDGGVHEDEDDDRKMPSRYPIRNRMDPCEEGKEGANEEGDDAPDSDPSDEDSQGVQTLSDGSIGDAELLAIDDDSTVVDQEGGPDDRNIMAFRSYCKKGASFADLTNQQVRSIKLLDILRRKRTPLDTYDDLLGWHLRETGSLIENEKLGQCPDYLSRKKLMSFLKKRYNFTDKMPFTKEIVLPHCNARIKVICADARNCVEQLLTDPRLTDNDFSFSHDNPLAPPPESMTYVSEMNTGEAYRNGYHAYVKKEGQMGIGIQWYIDGAVTGQFDNLSITALKMSLSCFTLDYRKKDQAWATLGFVVNYSAGKSRGKRMFADSLHDQALEELEGTFVSTEGEVSKKIAKAQDFHAQLDTILSSYVSVQATGMLWDLRFGGKMYRNVELVFWTVMVRADTDEAELLCGKYRSRSKHVAQLCRYCTCPTKKGDSPHADYDAKTISMIQDLIDIQDLEALKGISQQAIRNAWYKVRFDPTYDTGIHGACPSEMLHALHLGVFLYVRECFFAQIGPTSQLAKEIDGLAQELGDLFRHNSERDLPNCKFTHGIQQKKKLMAKEYRGVLLLIAAVLRSTRGRQLLSKNKHFCKEEYLKDWLLLVESLLQWEAFLCEPEMDLQHVERLESKNRFIMYLFKKVARRSEGMGLKIMKFHAIIHMASDIKLYGVPMEHDTGANESGHKVTKVAAKLTQKNMATFELQTAIRLVEFLIIEWAMAELNGRKLWSYYGNLDPMDPDADGNGSVSSTTSSQGSADQEADDESNNNEPVTTGTRMEVYWLGEEEPYMGIVDKNAKKSGKTDADLDRALVGYSSDLVEFLLELQDMMEEVVDDEAFVLPIYTEHKRNGEIFRGHPNYRKDGHWRDWALIDWGLGDGMELPGQIWCFVTLDGVPEGSTLKYGGVFLENVTYAVVESANWSTSEQELAMSDIFKPLKKVVKKVDKETGKVLERKFYLADVDAIAAPMCVIPDFGGKAKTAYFQVKARSAWVEDFVLWLEDEDDDISSSESEDEED